MNLSSEMGPVRQNPIQRTVRSIHVCALHCAQLLHTILHKRNLIIFPLALQTITIPMMSIEGRGDCVDGISRHRLSPYTAYYH